jgi:hypothetical protein
LTLAPAFAVDRYLTVLASNDLARYLSKGFDVGVSIPRALFLRDRPHRVDSDGHAAAVHVCAAVRRSIDLLGEDDGFIELVGELAALSMAFNAAWSQTSAAVPREPMCFRISGVGGVRLTYEQTFARDASGISAVVWHPADSLSERRLARLAVGGM